VLLAQVHIKNGEEKDADTALKTAVDIGRHQKRELGPDGKYAAAHARYMEGERVLAKFDAIQIQGDVKQLTGRLKQKAVLLKQASTIFLDVVSLGVAEWTTAALYQVGRTYEAFAKSLRESPAPSGLSDADKEAYQQQIDEFVVPIEENALDAYESGWKKATELGIYNQWTAKMRESLGRLNAELYPPFKEIGFDVRSQGPSPLPALIEAPRRDAAPAAMKPSSSEKPAAKSEPVKSEPSKPEKTDKPEKPSKPAPPPPPPAKKPYNPAAAALPPPPSSSSSSSSGAAPMVPDDEKPSSAAAPAAAEPKPKPKAGPAPKKK
jgi:cellulose synthase operon protein C